MTSLLARKLLAAWPDEGTTPIAVSRKHALALNHVYLAVADLRNEGYIDEHKGMFVVTDAGTHARDRLQDDLASTRDE